MFKLTGLPAMIAIGLLAPAPLAAAPLRSHAGGCVRADGPALSVQVAGFKTRHGTLRVQSYGGNAGSFFEKGRYIDRIDLPVPASGPALLCVPVERAGVYAVSVRHDLDGDRKTGRADGGGMSGNPHVSVVDLLLKRKPDPAAVSVRVGNGPASVPVTLNYIQGTAFRPVLKTAGR